MSPYRPALPQMDSIVELAQAAKQKVESKTTLATVDEDQMMSLYKKGYSDTAIGKIVNMNHSMVGYWRNKRGLSPNNPQPTMASDSAALEQAKELYLDGFSYAEIERRIGVIAKTVRTWKSKGLLGERDDEELKRLRRENTKLLEENIKLHGEISGLSKALRMLSKQQV